MKRRGLEPRENERASSAESSVQRNALQRLLSAVRVRVSRTNLGPPHAPLVGRLGELEALRGLLRTEKLVTVAGPAGIGKTRLVTECALQLLETYARDGGVWLVDLTEARSVDDACRAFGRALGVSLATAGADPVGQIGAVLSVRGRALIVLDHVDESKLSLSGALGEWLRVAPDTRWLSTARAPLGVQGEALFDLGPLCLPTAGVPSSRADAVQLFLARAQTPRFDRTAGGDDGAAVAQLVRDLGGNALDIELAAAQARVRPLQQLSTLLAQHAGPDAALEVAWSLLDPLARQTLAQCCVFAGGFDQEAATKVVELRSPYDATAVAASLESLREKALVTTYAPFEDRTAIRFALPPAVRAFARERLRQMGELQFAVARHARYFVAFGKIWARRLDGADAKEAAVRLAIESENLLAVHRRVLAAEEGTTRTPERVAAALEAALVVDALLRTTGPTPQRFALLDAAIQASAGVYVEDMLRVRALEARGEARRALGREVEARVDYADAIAAAGSTLWASGGALAGLGLIELAEGNVDLARSRLERSLEVFGQTGDRLLSARILGHLGRVYAFGGHTELARSAFEQAITLHAQVNDHRYEAMDVRSLGTLGHDAGRLDEAKRHYERALELSYLLGDRAAEARTVAMLGLIAHEQEQHADARELYERAVEALAEVGDRRAHGRLLGWYAVFLSDVGEPEQARVTFTKALGLLRACRDQALEALVLGALSSLEASEGCLDTARAAINRAAECVRTANPGKRYAPVVEVYRGHLELALARAAINLGDDRRATMYLDSVRQRLADAGTSVPRPSEPGLPLPRSPEMRLALRALRRAFELKESGDSIRPGPDSSGVLPTVEFAPESFVVCARGRWFRSPHGEQVPITRWRSLQNLVVKLAERRELAPGEALTVDELIAAGWPGERILPKAGATRVYTALSTLRRLGLRDVLVRTEGGYLFRSDIPILRV